MNDFNIHKCQKALKSIRKNNDEIDYKLNNKKKEQPVSKTDSPFLTVKQKNASHQKTKSYNGNENTFDFILDESSPLGTRNLPPIFLKEMNISIKKQNILKPVYVSSDNTNEESKNIEDNKKLKEEMYSLLYGKAYKNEKKEIISNMLKIVYSSKLSEQKIMSIRNSCDDVYVAVASYDGFVKILEKSKKKWIAYYSDPNNYELPISNIRWRPQSKEQNSVLFSYLHGDITLYDFYKEKELCKIKEKETKQIYGLDYNSDGSCFATCGNDIYIKLYDAETFKPSLNLTSPAIKDKYSNHIYAVKFDNNNPNILFTGGWDEIIYIWDLRKPNGYSNYLTGPLVCSDTLDCFDEKLLTGSWRNKSKLEIWDLRKYRKIQDLEWNCNDESLIQLCKFNKANNKMILAGGTNQAGVKIYKENTSIWQKIEDFELMGSDGANNSIYTGDFYGDITIGNNDGEVIIMNLLK